MPGGWSGRQRGGSDIHARVNSSDARERVPLPLHVKCALEVANEDAHVGVAAFGLALDAFEDGFLEGGRDIRVKLAGSNKIQGPIKLFAEDFLG